MISSTESARAKLIQIQDSGLDSVPADYHVEQMRAVLDQVDALTMAEEAAENVRDAFERAYMQRAEEVKALRSRVAELEAEVASCNEAMQSRRMEWGL